MFDIGDQRESALYLSIFFREKYLYIYRLSISYLSIIDSISINQVKRLRFWVPRSPEWIGSFLPTK